MINSIYRSTVDFIFIHIVLNEGSSVCVQNPHTAADN